MAFDKKAYDLEYQKKQATIVIRMTHEEKDLIDESAKKAGKSTRAFILDAVKKEIEQS